MRQETGDRDRVEAELLEALKAAQVEWEAARQSHFEIDRQIEIAKDLPPGQKDGLLALRQASRQTAHYTAALRKYKAALKAFSDFIAGRAKR